MMMDNNRKEALDKATKAKQKMMMAADSVRMPQDLQAGYMHMNRFGSPLPVHGLATPGRVSMAQVAQDQNFMKYMGCMKL